MKDDHFLCSEGNLCGFAACDRPTVIYVRNSQLQFSIVNTGEAVSMTPFHSQLFPDCLAIASDDSLMVSMLDNIQKVHVEKVDMDEDPHHICYLEQMSTYGGKFPFIALLRIEENADNIRY